MNIKEIVTAVRKTWSNGSRGKATCIGAGIIIVGFLWALMPEESEDARAEREARDAAEKDHQEFLAKVNKDLQKIKDATTWVEAENGCDGSEEFFGIDFKKSMKDLGFRPVGRSKRGDLAGGDFPSWRYVLKDQAAAEFQFVEVRTSLKTHMPVEAVFLQ